MWALHSERLQSLIIKIRQYKNRFHLPGKGPTENDSVNNECFLKERNGSK